MEQENLQRDFKGIWIPKDIWLEKELTALDKIILLEIDSLDVSDEGCYASNEYLANFCQCTETKISTSISKLIKMGYLEVVKFDGRKRYLKSNILLNADFNKTKRQTLKKLKADFNKIKDINIINNKDDNNKKNNIKKRFIPPTLEDVENYCKERKNNIDAKKFYDYYSISNWKDKDGNQVKNWKQKIITWEGRNNNNSKQQTIERKPDWFDKDLKNEKLTENEQQELDDLLESLQNDIKNIKN